MSAERRVPPLIAAQTPIGTDHFEWAGIDESLEHEEAGGLISAVLAALWSGDERIAREQIERAWRVASRCSDVWYFPELAYLARGRAEAVRVVRAESARRTQLAAEALDRAEAGNDAVNAALQARELLLPWYTLLLEEPPANVVARLERIAATLGQGEEAGTAGAKVLRDHAREVGGWRALREGRLDAAQDLVDLYDKVDEEDFDSVTWADLPRFELVYAIDHLRRAGAAPDLARLGTLPPLIAQRGGWDI